ncbi:MAG: hypothetical protein KAR83_00390 [Thermodesulfovibrionales bacterium]|nr:hypothetical protein [Thermodesulfovibrionales bacterium]
MVEKTVLYFDEPGESNTKACIDRVRYEVEENGYRFVVVASSTGETGVEFAKALKDLETEVYIVKYVDSANKTADISDDMKKELADNNATFFSSPAISLNLDGAFGLKLAPMGPSKVVYWTLKRFGEGLKVCCEIIMMATDKGLLTEGVEAIAVAGTKSGADTVAVIRGSASMRFRELKVMEIIAKPRG